MRIAKDSGIRCIFAVVTIAALAAGLSLCSPLAGAQTCPTPQQGNNTIYATCSGSTTMVGSSAFIDASVWGSATTPPDYCVTLGHALSAVSSSISVIDARGLTSSNTTMSCANSPWNGIANPLPATILLGPGTISISAEWVLPDRTRIIGEVNNLTDNVGTTLKAAVSFTTGAMIEFCTAACSGVSVANVYLDGNEIAVPGIMNQYAGDLSYVDHVTFLNFKGTEANAALYIATGSATQNSGPYSNLTCQPASQASPTGDCVDLEASSTHGIHGMTCVYGGSDPDACIRVNGSGNTIEDVHVEGFYDGIAVGTESSVDVYGNTLVNINAGDGTGPVVNLIQLCGSFSSSMSPCASRSTITVGDVSIFGVFAEHTNGGGGITNLLEDDVTDTIFAANSTNATPVTMGIYALGDSVTNAGISRLTTSSRDTSTSTSIATAPAWVSGSGSAPTTGGCPVGSLYSNESNSGTASNTLWVCVGSSGGGSSWTNIK